MTVLTPTQIAHVARQAGFRGPQLTWAVAVALAESGGRTDAKYVNSDKYHSVDRGLWQINNHWHPEVSDAQAYDPLSAAQAAYRISGGGQHWSPWSTYKNGHAQAQYDRARMATHPRAARAAGGATPAPSSGGTAAASPKAPGVGSTGGGSTPGNTSATSTPNAQNAGLLGDLAPLGGLVPGIGPSLSLGASVLDDLNPVSNPLKGIEAVGRAAVDATKLSAGIVTALFDPHTYVRGAFIIVGGGAVLLGAYLLAKSGTAGDTAQGIARSASSTVKTATKAAALA